MAGTGIWLSDQDLLQTGGAIWAQQQMQGVTQRVQAGQDWASQQLERLQQQATAQVQQIAQPAPAPTPPPAPALPPPPMPTPAAIAPPPPQPTPAPADVAPPPTPPMPTPDTSAPAPPPPMPTMPSTTPTPEPSMLEAGQSWAQQQIQNLLNPSQNAPAGPTATPGAQTPSAPSPTPNVAGAPSGPQPGAPGDLIDLTRQAAQRAGIDPDIFSRQIKQESGFNPNAGSPAGAQGIAQFMPQTAQGLGIDPMDPGQALPAAANLMRSYLDKYGGDWGKALAAYNAGPGAVDRAGGVPDFAETKNYVQTILGGAQDLIQKGQTAVNTAVQGVQSAVARTSQFGLGLSSGDAMAFCGPTAALAFAQTYGRNPTVDEAKQLAQQVGWNPSQGMAGPQSEVKLLNAMGIDAHMTSGVDWSNVAQQASGGNPVIVDTPGHYYYVDGYNADTGKFHVGTSGTDLKGGAEWMSPDQINAMPQSGGGARAAIYADHPLTEQRLTMGTMQPAGPGTSSGDLIGGLGSAAGGALGAVGGAVGGALGGLGGAAGDLLGGAGRAIQDRAQQTLQAVQDVGSQATQKGLDLLSQGRDLASSGNDILNLGLPQLNAQNDLLQPLREGLTNTGDALGGALNQALYGPRGRPMTWDEMGQSVQTPADVQANPFSLIPSNPLALLGGMSPFGIGTAGEQLTNERNAAIEQGNPLRDVPVMGGLSTLAAQTGLDPTNWLLGAGPTLGRTTVGLAGDVAGMRAPESLRNFLGEESGALNTERLQQLWDYVSSPPVGQPDLPGMPPAAGDVTMGERARLYHVGNAIGNLATVSKVALNSMLNPAWSFSTRGAADLLGGITGLAPGLTREEAFGRAHGSLLGMQAGLSQAGQFALDGLRQVYGDPSAVANRATNLGDQIFGRVWQTPAATHSMFQNLGQNVLSQIELGRLYGQDAARLGLQGQAFIDHVAQGLANPRADWLETANGLAQRAVLRGDLGTLGQYFANAAGQGAGQAGTARSLLGNFLFPVFRVGMNALTQSIEKSPLGLAGTGIDVARATTPLGRIFGAGPYAGGAFEQPLSNAVAPLSERLTNNLAGTAISGLMAKWALDGSITGDGPADPKQRAMLQAQGWQPKSIRTPGGYISYANTPLEGSLSAVGNFADAVNNPQSNLEQQQSTLLTVSERMLGSVLNDLASPTAIETIGNISDMIHGLQTGAPEEMMRGGAGTLAGLLSSWVPMSGTLRGVEQMTDPLQRRAAQGDVLGTLATGIPGLAQLQPPRLDALGQAVPNAQQGLGALLPMRIGAANPQSAAIAQAMGTAGVTTSAPPTTVPYGPMHDVRLTPQERNAFEQYRGQLIQQMASQFVSSPEYATLTPVAQRVALQQITQQADQYATLLVQRDIAPDVQRNPQRMVPTGMLAPVQSYQPVGLGPNDALAQQDSLRRELQHRALMQSLLGGGTGQQMLQLG